MTLYIKTNIHSDCLILSVRNTVKKVTNFQLLVFFFLTAISLVGLWGGCWSLSLLHASRPGAPPDESPSYHTALSEHLALVPCSGVTWQGGTALTVSWYCHYYQHTFKLLSASKNPCSLQPALPSTPKGFLSSI